MAQMMYSARQHQPGSGIFGTITSSINSDGDNHNLKQGSGKRYQNLYQRNEIMTQIPQASGYERISYGSNLEIHHNFQDRQRIQNVLLGTIGSNDGVNGTGSKYSDDHPKYRNQLT